MGRVLRIVLIVLSIVAAMGRGGATARADAPWSAPAGAPGGAPVFTSSGSGVIAGSAGLTVLGLDGTVGAAVHVVGAPLTNPGFVNAVS